MAAPVTSGQERTNLTDMEIGDYIACEYTASSNTCGIFVNLGSVTKDEIPITGTETPNGKFYFIKVDKGLCIADRVVQSSISWNTLNTGGFIEGSIPAYNLVPEMISNDAPNGIVEASGYYRNGSDIRAPWKVFDRKFSATDNWSTTLPAWISYTFIEPTKVERYGILGGASGSSPKQWTFEGWDGNSWVVLDTQTLLNDLYPNKVFFDIKTPDSYLKYRLNINANFGYSTVLVTELYMSNKYLIRSLSGGVIYIDANGNPVTTAPSPQLGGWPPENEWDKYIVSSNLDDKITPGDDNIWHAIYNPHPISWCRETSLNGVTYSSGNSGANTKRICRPHSSTIRGIDAQPSTYTGAAGFRPVLEYLETDAKATTLWY